MSKLIKINSFRRRLMYYLTKRIGNSYSKTNEKIDEEYEFNHILICRPNQRLGNLLLTTPLIQEVEQLFPDCKIDIIVKGGLANILFKNYHHINKIFQLPKRPFKRFNLIKYIKVWLSVRRKRYDLVINGERGSSSGRLLTSFARSKYKLFGDLEEEVELTKIPEDYTHMAKNCIYEFRKYMQQLGFEANFKPIPFLHLKLTDSEIKEGEVVLRRIISSDKEKLLSIDKKTICIFTYATGNKCYSKSWWFSFYELLKKTYTDYNIIEVLPIENVSQIDFRAPTFYSEDVREIGGFMANTDVFIGADSGIMHLASASFIPTIGLFSSTNKKLNVYKPYNPGSIALNTKETKQEDWIEAINEILKINYKAS